MIMTMPGIGPMMAVAYVAALERPLDGSQDPACRRAPAHDPKITSNSASSIVEAGASAELRDRLMAELANVGSAYVAATWARRSLRAKNELAAADARRVEEAFQARLAVLEGGAGERVSEAPAEELQRGGSPAVPIKRPLRRAIEKAQLAIPEPRRVRETEITPLAIWALDIPAFGLFEREH